MLCAAVIGAVYLAVYTASAQTFKRITTEAEFRSTIVDRRASSDAGWMTVNSDGTTSGVFFEQNFAANWVWQNQMYCRNAVLGDQALGTDCQVVEISGDSVRYVRENGRGEAGVMTLE